MSTYLCNKTEISITSVFSHYSHFIKARFFYLWCFIFRRSSFARAGPISYLSHDSLPRPPELILASVQNYREILNLGQGCQNLLRLLKKSTFFRLLLNTQTQTKLSLSLTCLCCCLPVPFLVRSVLATLRIPLLLACRLSNAVIRSVSNCFSVVVLDKLVF